MSAVPKDDYHWLFKYSRKERILVDRFGENIPPRDFYSELFNNGVDLQSRDSYGDGKANIIVLSKNDERQRIWHRYTIHADNNFEDLEKLPHNDFAFFSPISYFGKKRVLKNARFMYALGIDLDGVTEKTLENGLLFQIQEDIIPRPTYIVNSGHGLHLYYKFEVPIPMYPAMREKLQKLKDELIDRIWNQYTSEDEKKQFQSINQGFRVVGGATKQAIIPWSNDDKPLTAEVKVYRTGKEVTLKYLSDYVSSLADIDFEKVEIYKSNLSLQEAKERYPEWYEKRIVNKEPIKRWAYSRAVYDYWKKKIYEGATFGHRYWCLYTLAAFAVKCGEYDAKKNPNPITYEELVSDAEELRGFLNKLSAEPFTERDMWDALKVYNDEELAYRLTKRYLEMETAISMPPKIRRNGEQQKWHLEDARAKKERMKKRGQSFKAPEGRPSAEEKVKEYLDLHPDARAKEIAERVGVSEKTAYKWRKILLGIDT